MSGQVKRERKVPLKEHATVLGSLGASLGGSARAKKLTKKERSKQATHAAKTRWD